MTFARAGLLMSAGGLCWAVHFAAIYGFTGIACARGLGSAVPWALTAFTLAACIGAGLVLRAALRRREVFEYWLAAALAGAALVAILWEALSALLATPCG